jgi:hypothetical protein
MQIEVTDHSSLWSAFFQLIKERVKLMTMQNCDDLPSLDSGLNDSSGSSARTAGPLTPNARTAARGAM